MRRVFEGRSGMALAFVLGLVIATAGTATAAKLITGKQIKDGTISTKDLSKALRAQLQKARVPGPAGPQGPLGETGARGEAGAAGPLLDVLPSGRTLTGVYLASSDTTAPGKTIAAAVTFQVPLASGPTGHFVGLGNPVPAECAGGSAVEPRAAPGHLCVFEAGTASRTFDDFGNPENNKAGSPVGRRGFNIFFLATSSNAASLGTWAVTAP